MRSSRRREARRQRGRYPWVLASGLVALYTASVVFWVHAVYDRAAAPAELFSVVLALLITVHLSAGFVLGWFSLPLVGVLLAIAASAGSRDGDPDGFPVIGAALLYWVGPALVLLVAGAACRSLIRRLPPTRRNPARGPQLPR